MTSAQYLRDFISERLRAVAVEILSMFEQTIVQFEQKMERQRRLLETCWKPDNTVFQQQCVSKKKKKKKKVNQKRNSNWDQEEQKSPQIKEEEEELFSGPDGEQRVLKQATHILIESPPKGQIDNYQLERNSEQIVSHNSLREFVNGLLTAAAVEILSVLDETMVQYEEEIIDHQHKPFDISRRLEVKPAELSQQQEGEIEQDFSEQQLCHQTRNSILDQEDPEPPQIKEQEEGLRTSQEGEQRALKQEPETFMVSNVMQSKKKGTKVKNSTSGCCLGRERGAETQEAPEESSESEAESTAPPPASHMDMVAEGHQPTIQYFSGIDGELTPIVAAKSHKKRKRELVTAGFTKEQEQDMVEWLMAPEQHCLLNKKHPNYIKKGLKDTAWDQKAREMGKTSDQLKKWYANMRSRFGKLKQTPSGSGDTELTARDQWILYNFEFLKPYLIVHVNKRVAVNMKAKVGAMAAPSATERIPQSACDDEATDHHPSTAAQSAADTSLGSRATENTEASRSNIDELQRQLLNKLSKAEKSPLERQKDIFADFIKEVTYTFPLIMWLRFQKEVNSLLQKYQFELYQVCPT